MTAIITPAEFNQLRLYIKDQCGIALGDEKAYLIETRLTPLMLENGCDDFTQFYLKIQQEKSTVLRDKIIDAMTTNETLWFRDKHPFVILQDKIFPDLAEQFQSGRYTPIRIWSAACSTGQEPYSISMTIHEFCANQSTFQPRNFEILATDISSSSLYIAKAGRYDPLAIKRGLSEEMRNRYFTLNGRSWILDERIKQRVTFKKYNLIDTPQDLGIFDIVFLRYVSIYFSETLKCALLNNITKILKPNGILFLGGVESLLGMNTLFTIAEFAGGHYYTRQPHQPPIQNETMLDKTLNYVKYK